MKRRKLVRPCLLVAATILGATLPTGLALSETFLALGLPAGGPSRGWTYGYGSTANDALNYCRGVTVGTNKNNGISDGNADRPPDDTEAERACKIIGDLKGQCFAFASNGSEKVAASALGWTIADSDDSAREGAMSKCAAMRSGTVSACILRYSYCDKPN